MRAERSYKHSRVRPGCLLRSLALGLLIWGLMVAALLVAIQTTATIDESQSAEVIIVLGAGIQRDGTAGRALTRRATRAAELYHLGYAPRLLCSGGMPVARPRSEAIACAELLGQLGVPLKAIFLEDQSRSTEENALYSAAWMEAQGLRRALVVSDGFHMWRARLIFSAYGAPEGLQWAYVAAPGAERAVGYWQSVLREVAAVHWFYLRRLLAIEATYIPGI
ncbi:MAG: YdcF family protein [Anaerolineae bacterium]|nr:YdcF family protein [Anaerolineae bacterium]